MNTKIIAPYSTWIGKTFSKGGKNTRKIVLRKGETIYLCPAKNEHVVVLPVKSLFEKLKTKLKNFDPMAASRESTVKVLENFDSPSATVTIKAPYKEIFAPKINHLDTDSHKIQKVFAPYCDSVNANNVQKEVNANYTKSYVNILHCNGTQTAKGTGGNICANFSEGNLDATHTKGDIIINNYKGKIKANGAKGKIYALGVNPQNIEQ